MLKAALLYADAAKLCSPSFTMLASITALSEIGATADPVGQWDLIKPVLENYFQARDPLQAQKAHATFKLYEQLRRKNRRTGPEMQAKVRIEGIIHRMWKEMHSQMQMIGHDAGLKQIVSAIESGVLTIHPLTSSFVSDDFLDSLLRSFFDFLHDSLQVTNAYPLFDDQSGNLVRAGIREGKIEPTSSALRHGKNIGLAAQLLQGLPLFDLATVDEVLGIRRDLENPLVRFRSAVWHFSERITNAQWDQDFSQDAQDLYTHEVAPALLDIEEAIRSNSYLGKLTSRVANQPQNFTGPAVAIALSQYEAVPDVVSLLVGAGTLGVALHDIRREWKERQAEIAKNQLFFLYQAGRELQNRF